MTAFFLRRNHDPTKLIDNVQGYAHAFPEAHTTWGKDVKGSTLHQRVIRYLFGRLQFFVRFEADGYILSQDDELEDEGSTLQPGETSAPDRVDVSGDFLIQTLLAKGLAMDLQPAKGSKGSPTVNLQGRPVPQSSIIDLKTRSVPKQRHEIMAEQLPRLWLRQIHKFVLAFHDKGCFNPPVVSDATDEIDDWVERSNIELKRLATVVRDICDTVKSAKDGKLEIRGDESSTLCFHNLSADNAVHWNAMSDALLERWVRL